MLRVSFRPVPESTPLGSVSNNRITEYVGSSAVLMEPGPAGNHDDHGIRVARFPNWPNMQLRAH